MNEKGFLAFYNTRNSVGPKIRFWLNTKKGKRFPDFDGIYGEKRVGIYLRKSSRGGFFAIFENIRLSNGRYSQIATARVVCNAEGIPKLAIHSEGKIFWAEVAKKVPLTLLIECGLDIARMRILKNTFNNEVKIPLNDSEIK